MTEIFQPLLPPTRRDLLEFYHKARSSIWYEDEIVYSSDIPDFQTMSIKERHFIELILGFFAVSDRIVLANLIDNFIQEINIPEAKLFYNFQAVCEDVHSLTYTNHLVTLVQDQQRLSQLLNSIENFSSISKKSEWAMKYMNRDVPLAQRIVAFSIVEAVFFCSSFCAIFWLKTQNKLVKGVGTSNEFISRDETLHSDFACALYRGYYTPVSEDIIRNMLQDAADVEFGFVDELLDSQGFIGMNRNLMKQYVKYVIDRLAIKLGIQIIFNVENPFPFMANLSLHGKTNFFEKRVTEYAKVNVSSDSLAELDDF